MKDGQPVVRQRLRRSWLATDQDRDQRRATAADRGARDLERGCGGRQPGVTQALVPVKEQARHSGAVLPVLGQPVVSKDAGQRRLHVAKRVRAAHNEAAHSPSCTPAPVLARL